MLAKTRRVHSRQKSGFGTFVRVGQFACLRVRAGSETGPGGTRVGQAGDPTRALKHVWAFAWRPPLADLASKAIWAFG